LNLILSEIRLVEIVVITPAKNPNKIEPKKDNQDQKKLEKNNKNNKEEGSSIIGKKKNDQFEKEKKPTQKKNFIDIFEGRYKKFIELVNPLVGIRGKRMNIAELHYFIEEIYS
jgi:hypothetical protein